MSTKPARPAREIGRIRNIANSLEALRWKRLPGEDIENEIVALTDAVCEDRWDLVTAAAQLISDENNPQIARLDRRRMVDDAKWVAYCLYNDSRLNIPKDYILKYIKLVYPEMYATIPKGRVDWWKDALGERTGEQKRGKLKEPIRSEFMKMIENAILARRAGFPDFLGPRENPNWE